MDLELAAVFAALDSARNLPSDVFLAVNVSPQTVTTTRFSRLLDSTGWTGSLAVELTEHAIVEDVLEPGISVVEKPFTSAELLRKIRALLPAPADTGADLLATGAPKRSG